MGFLRTFDRLSFWLGFLAGSLFWFVATRLWPFLAAGLDVMKSRLQRAGREVIGDINARYRKELLKHVQGLHLAAPLFALDEVLVQPRVLLEEIPPLDDEEAAKTSGPDVVTSTVLWTPDWTEMAAFYHHRSAPLTEVVADGAHLAIIAPPGYGKTVALAALASAFARQDVALGERRTYLPLWIHAADLDITADEPVEALMPALSTFLGTLTRAQLPSRVHDALVSGQAVLLLDGLDELPPPRQEAVIQWLKGFMEEHTLVQVIAGADSHFFDGLLRLGLVPLALSAWSREERHRFLARWAHAWENHIASNLSAREGTPEPVDPLLVSLWLREGALSLSPMELTLRAWGAFAGDLPGGRPHHALDAHLRRLVTEEHLPALQVIAATMLTRGSTSFTPKQAREWLGESPEPPIEAEAASEEEATPTPVSHATRAIDQALENGLLVHGADDALRFVHVVLAGHLAGAGIRTENADWRWGAMCRALRSAAVQRAPESWLLPLLEKAAPPLLHPLLEVARWLPDAPPKTQWRVETLRRLARTIHDSLLPLGLRQVAALALSLSGDTGVVTLFRKLLEGHDAHARQIAALNLGLLRDRSSVKPLTNALSDPHPGVGQAAALALVAIGGEQAIDAVANVLLHGEEEQRRAVAEALANDEREGHLLLKEAITLEEVDVVVRRAAIFGLTRIEAPWAREALEKMQYEEEWVVKNSAIQAVEEIAYRKAHRLDRPLPLTGTPWLVAFAAEQGLGVAPGEPAIQMLLRALQYGNEDQRLFAARRLRFLPMEGALAPLYHALYGASDLDYRETVWQTLWYQQAGGINLPSPQQFGLG